MSNDPWKLLESVVTQFRHTGCECTFPSNTCCAYAEAKTALEARDAEQAPVHHLPGHDDTMAGLSSLTIRQA